MWPNTTDFSDWQWDGYISDDPAEHHPDPVFGWCRIAARKIDGVIEKVTEWRFTVESPNESIGDDGNSFRHNKRAEES